MTEEWKAIPGFSSYEASTLGNIRRSSTGALLGGAVSNGYRKVFLGADGEKAKLYLAHRLVALAFFGEPTKQQPFVNHKNGDKLDNRIDNLEYSSPWENTAHYHSEIKPNVVKNEDDDDGDKVLTDHTRNERTQRREQALAEKLVAAGWDGKSALFTAILNGTIEVPPNPRA